MKSKIVLLRADGNARIGLGHLYRIHALGEILSDYEKIFITRDADFIKNNFNNLKQVIHVPDSLSTENEPSWINEQFPGKEYILITDGYEFGAVYQQKIKSFGFKLVCIDDLAEHYFCADYVINHSLAVDETRYKKSPDTRLLTGSNYIILRKEFYSHQVKKESAILKRAFICLGGSDPENYSQKIADMLTGQESITNICVIVGKAFTGSVSQLGSSSKIAIHQNIGPEGMVRYMSDSDFAVVSASGIAYECAALGLPFLMGYYVNNQVEFYHALSKYSGVFGVGDFNNFDEKELLRGMSELGKSKNKLPMIIDGSQISRFKNIFANLNRD